MVMLSACLSALTLSVIQSATLLAHQSVLMWSELLSGLTS
jgi:hypothetical protein